VQHVTLPPAMKLSHAPIPFAESYKLMPHSRLQ
jgi:hypothetical protein